MDKKEQFQLGSVEGVIFLDGLLFIRESMIRANDPVVQRTFEDLYKHISKN